MSESRDVVDVTLARKDTDRWDNRHQTSRYKYSKCSEKGVMHSQKTMMM